MPLPPITIENLIDFYVDKFDTLLKNEMGNDYVIRTYKVMTAEVSIIPKMLVGVVVINKASTTNISIGKDAYQENYSLEFYIGINTNESELKRAVTEIVNYIKMKNFEFDLMSNFSNVLGAINSDWDVETNYDENYRFHIAKIIVNFFVIKV
jgi:hypothetical protein